ncbi:MAG: 50S ribosomal protein L19 [Planctomycetota bacterium]
MNTIHELEKNNFRSEPLPPFNVGDTVNVECIIREGTKERTQTFTGVVISIKGRGNRKNFTVRRIVQGEGVEKIFPYHSPLVKDISLKKRGVVRRAKLYYLRDRSGKSARIRERIETSKSKSKG